MNSAGSWLQKLQAQDRMKAKIKEGDGNNGGNQDLTAPLNETPLSNVRKQKVAAAKQYIENHYKEQTENPQKRKK